jgi:hypothetical protein
MERGPELLIELPNGQVDPVHKPGEPCWCLGCVTVASLMLADPNPKEGDLLERVGMAIGYMVGEPEA